MNSLLSGYRVSIPHFFRAAFRSKVPAPSSFRGPKARWPVLRFQAAVVAGLLSALTLPAAVFFQTPIVLESPNAQPNGYCGAEGVAAVPDVNGDGVPDLVIPAMCDSPDGSPSCAGRVYVFDGVTRAVLLELKSPNEIVNGAFGENVAGIEDLNGNGSGEVIVGADGERRVYVMDGSDGTLIHTLSVFAVALSTVPDVNEDGLPEILVGSSGAAGLYDGASGSLLRSLGPVGSFTSLYGWSVSGLSDVNDNGTGEVIVSDWMVFGSEGRTYVFDGGTGNLIHTLAGPEPRGNDSFGRAVAGIGDLNGDGRGDIIVGASNNARGNFIFDGVTGDHLYQVTVPPQEEMGGLGWNVAELPDVTDDGLSDLLVVGNNSSPIQGFNVYVHDGSTGDHLATLPGHRDYGGGDSLTGIPDLNGDGRGEVLMGNWSAISSEDYLQAGHVLLYLSDVDSDGDGMPDAFETTHNLSPQSDDANLDEDEDGLSNLVEYEMGTSPIDVDSDDDGLSDGVETGTGIWGGPLNTGTSPLLADSDRDGLSDGDEVSLHDTDPNIADSDGDLYPDGWEVAYDSNPNESDDPVDVPVTDLGEPIQEWHSLQTLPSFNNYNGGLDQVDATFRVQVDLEDKMGPDREVIFRAGGSIVGFLLYYEEGNRLALESFGNSGGAMARAAFAVPPELVDGGDVELMGSYEVDNPPGRQTITLWVNGVPVASGTALLGGDWSGTGNADFGTVFQSGTINLSQGLRFFSGVVPRTLPIPRPVLEVVDWAEQSFRLRMRGSEFNRRYLLERSTNLVDWTEMRSLTALDTNSLDILETTVGAGDRSFYRLRRGDASPWRFVSSTGTVNSPTNLFLFLSNAGSVYIDDIRLVEGEVAGVGTNLILNGDFESELSGPWLVPEAYAGSTLSSEQSQVGSASLQLVATGFPFLSTIIRQDLPPLDTGHTYTLSYWYLPNTNDLILTVRLSDNTVVASTDIGD